MKPDQNQAIENFLAHLDQALDPMPVSQKAEIIIEMRSHILDSLESATDKNIQKVLSTLGRPTDIANRYLFERGMTPVRKSKSMNNQNHSWAKWLAIGAIGSSFMLVVLPMLIVLIAAPFYSPLVEVDENTGKVRLFNGLIKVDERKKISRLEILTPDTPEQTDSELEQKSPPELENPDSENFQNIDNQSQSKEDNHE